MKSESAAVTIRQARKTDVRAIAAMFAADTLGGHGDSADPADLPSYEAAFTRIAECPNDELYVAVLDGEVVGTFQTTLITTMTACGSSSLNIEAVHTRHDMRGRGIGETMIRFAINKGEAAGVRLVQLTSNSIRADAHRFYRRLDFVQSHVGFKMKLR
jgi:GNAT superfamily N-acetyltransferase